MRPYGEGIASMAISRKTAYSLFLRALSAIASELPQQHVCLTGAIGVPRLARKLRPSPHDPHGTGTIRMRCPWAGSLEVIDYDRSVLPAEAP